MSAQEITSLDPQYSTPSSPPPPSTPSSTTNLTNANGMGTTDTQNAFVDIGEFVSKYNKMMGYLYPLELVGTTILRIIRWENYFLTLLVLVLLCMLFYHPALLAGSVVGSAVMCMAVGKYYNQSKLNLLLRRRQIPELDYHNEDYHTLRKCQKDQKASHNLLLEYRQIICNTEVVISTATRTLDYFYKIIFWKSLEVSLCVTVLLCVLLTLLCIIRIQILLASLPLLVLCINRHFIRRTVELWKGLFGYLFKVVWFRRRRNQSQDKTERESQSLEVVHHHQEPSEDTAMEGVSPPNEAGEGRGLSRQTSSAAAAAARTSTQQGGNGATEAGTADREGAGPPSNSKVGSCYNCNASFAKLLKRKHDCNWCGQTFCGSCTVKVKRAVLGATSPAAFEESVRVCQDCKNQLDQLQLSSSEHPHHHKTQQ